MSDIKKSAGGAATPSADAKLINFNSIIRQAQEKIKTSGEKKLGRYENAVNSAVANALCEFCSQSDEFARAIVESDKTYDDCLTAICKGLGKSISDFDLYTKAVRFWFPGAVVEYKMTIRMSEYEAEEDIEKPEPKPEELFEIADSLFYAYELISFSEAAGTTVMRMFRYLTENNLSAVIYRDYIDQCRKLGYDMHDTAIGLPHDLLAAHERFSQIIMYEKTEKAKREFTKWFEKRKIFEYETDTLILRQPLCYEEIIAEGRALCHCVGGYAERHSEGKTNIFFIRKKSEPLKPYYTIEVAAYHIVQCYGYKNNRTIAKPDEIKAFEQEYQNYLEELKNGQKRIKLKSA